ncbi:hypothetical protein FACS1894111_05680 [Clostridia bacterium]|nr:hypothetical protein FACS1894111_05680 [Clostridia bacterium]
MPTVEYRGGIPELHKTGSTVVDAFPDCLVVFSTGFSFKQYKIPYKQMLDISFVPEGARKKNYVLNVEYELENGFKSCVILSGKDVSKLYGSLQKYRQKYYQRNLQKVSEESSDSQVTDSVVDVAAEIQKFHDLKEKGIISEEEFTAKKEKLLEL